MEELNRIPLSEEESQLIIDDQEHVVSKYEESLAQYAGESENIINQGLRRKQLSKKAKNLVDDIISALDDIEPMEPLVLFRGIRLDFQLKIGDVIDDLGFMSELLIHLHETPHVVFSF